MISPIRLIDENGQNLGVVDTAEALAKAQAKGLDLIEIVPHARPPVCRIMDYGKYQYQKAKKESKLKQKQPEIKGIRIGLQTGEHDLETKAKQTKKFLEKGHKIRIELILRGREKALREMAKEKMNEFIKLIGLAIKIDQEIKFQPRGLTVVITK